MNKILWIVGGGMRFPKQLTLEALNALMCADAVCAIYGRENLERCDLPFEAESLLDRYRDRVHRTFNYVGACREVISALEQKGSVAYLTPGHPMMYDAVSALLIDAIGDRSDVELRIVAGISAVDEVSRIVGADFAPLTTVTEATHAVDGPVRPSPLSAHFFIQVDAIRNPLFVDESTVDPRAFRDFVGQLCMGLGAESCCELVRVGLLAGDNDLHRRCQLKDLLPLEPPDYFGTTLYVAASS